MQSFLFAHLVTALTLVACFYVDRPDCRVVCLKGFYSQCIYIIEVLRRPSCAEICLSHIKWKINQKNEKIYIASSCTCDISQLQNFYCKYQFYSNLKLNYTICTLIIIHISASTLHIEHYTCMILRHIYSTIRITSTHV